MGEYNQISFKGGMNLLYNDTRIAENEYREGFNVRCRFDSLDQIRTAKLITSPPGKKQGIFTFGDYLLLFVEGAAYYQFRDVEGWQVVPSFTMSRLADRVYIEVIPVNTTNYARFAILDSNNEIDAAARISLHNNPSAATGNFSGILVQNGVDQAWFIYIDNTGIHARLTKKYSEWAFSATNDAREYVPVGTVMAWIEGALHMVAPDGETIYRSVTGRPLDFVINVDKDGQKGGDATTTSYSVGVGGITCLRAMSDGSLFVSAANVACYSVTVDRSNNARTIFGEPTFIRRFLFNAGAMNDKVIVDILGDTAFVDLDGLRSYNSVSQLQNEGRNSVFSLTVSKLFAGVTQTSTSSAAILFDNYALFAVNTIYGNIIIVYDTLNKCFVSMDTQTNGVAVRQFAKIDTDVQRLYCFTANDEVFQLYAGINGDSTPQFATSSLRIQSICAGVIYASSNIKMQCPTKETQLKEFRAVLSGFRQQSQVTATFFVDNRQATQPATHNVKYLPPSIPYGGDVPYDDVDSGLINLLWTVTNCQQGWKTFAVVSWNGGGSITNMYAALGDISPKNSLKAQANQLTTTE